MSGGLIDGLAGALQGVASGIGQLSCCYVRAAAGVQPGSTPAWQYTLVPLSPSATPVAFPVSFTAQAPALLSQADAIVTVAVDVAKAAVGEIKATVTVDLTPIKGRPPVIDHPELDVVICPQGSIATSSWSSPPKRLEVIMLGVRAETIAELPDKLTVTADVPGTDQHTTTIDVAIEGEGAATLPLRVASVEGPPQTEPAALDLPLLSTVNIPGLGSLLSGLGLGGLLGGGTVQVQNVSIYTVDPGPTTSGFDATVSIVNHNGAMPVSVTEQIVTSWSPAAQPAVLATAQTAGTTAVRYAVAMVGTDGSESPPGASSGLIRTATGTEVDVTLPPAPSTSLFASWRLYRARLAGGVWSDWIKVADGAGAGTVHDAVPASEPGGPYAVPARVTVDHNKQAPNEVDVTATVVLLDDAVVAATGTSDPAQTLVVTAGLPASTHVAWDPVRRGTGPGRAVWQAPTASRTVDATAAAPRSGTHVHANTPAVPATVAAQLDFDDPATSFLVTWSAADAMDVIGDAVISRTLSVPSASVSRLPATFTAAGAFNANGGPPPTVVGWRAGAATGPIAARVKQLIGSDPTPTWTDVVLASVPEDAAVSLLLPPAGGGHTNVTVGRWDGPPAAGTVPASPPVVTGVPMTVALGQLLLHRRRSADATPPVPGPGPGPATSALMTLDDSGLTSLRTRLDALTALVLDLPAVPAGETQVTAMLQRASSDRAIRIQIASDSASNGTHGAQQVRVRDAGTVDLSVHATPVGLHVETAPGADSLLGIRVWADASTSVADRPDTPIGTFSQAAERVTEVDALAPGAAVDLRGLAADGSDGPVRLTLATPQPAGGRTAARFVQHDQTQGTTQPVPWLAADAILNTATSLVAADGGLLGAGSGFDGSGSAVLIDPDAGFAAGWVGRQVTVEGWPRPGTVTAVSSATELTAQPPAGAQAPQQGDWYSLTASSDFGLRLRTDGAGTRLRAAVARGSHEAPLAGVTATPQVRVGNDDLDAFAGVTVRLPALGSADVSSWSGDGEAARLLGTLEQPELDKALAPPPPPPIGWTSARASQAARANPSLLAVVHRPAPCPPDGQTIDKGFDPVNARLLQVPNELGLLLGSGIGTEVSAPGATGVIRLEGLQRRPDAVSPGTDPNAGTERGYSHISVDTGFPPVFALVTGWKNPDLDGGVPLSQMDTFMGRRVSHWQPACARITATGGPLALGRVVVVSYAGPLNPFSSPTFEWSVNDIWFLTLTPSGGGPAELLLYSPASIIADDNQDQAVEVAVANGTATSRIFSVSVDDGKHGLQADSCRRAAKEVGNWPLKLTAEIQLKDVTGKFAVKLPNIDFIDDQFEDDSTTAGEWWMGAYGKAPWFGRDTAQFGSDFGTIDMRGSPFPPYWV